MWMGASWDEAGRHQRPLPDGVLKIIASGEREDPPPEAATNSQAFPLLARKAIAPFGPIRTHRERRGGR